jgi:drug/metabolite transporter (DMT)-like permease
MKKKYFFMSKLLVPFLVIGLMGIITVTGDFFMKIAGNTNKFIVWKWFVLGFILYSITAFGWFWVMKYMKLSTVGVFYAISTVLLLVILSVFYFKESLNGYEAAGIVSAVISLGLLWRFAG